MIAILLLVAAVALVLLWALETAPVEPHGLDSFPAPPPIPCSCPDRHLGRLIIDGAPHVASCAFAEQSADRS